MSDEDRLIRANALKDRLVNLEASGGHKYYRQGMNDTLHKFMPCIIDDAPTVNAVEVVRCKGCKQWSRNCGIAKSPNGHCFYHDIDTNGYDFCSYGERRTDHV